MLLKQINHFLKFTKHFWSNGNYFSVDYIFTLTKHRKVPKSFFKNHFTLKQTEHKQDFLRVEMTKVLQFLGGSYFDKVME
jgi:hypothetical protein